MALQDLTPQLRTRLSRMERAVGWFVMLALGLLAFGFVYYVYHTAERKGWFLLKAPYYTFLDSASGLKVGDPVMLMGFDAGSITDIQPMPPEQFAYNVYVEFVLKAPNFGYIWTEGSRAKVASAAFLGNRVLEVTKGTGGYATYVFHPLQTLTVAEARAARDPSRWLLAEELHVHGTNLIARPPNPLTNLEEIVAAGFKTILVMDTNETRKTMTGVWDDKLGRYEIYTNGVSKYWLLSDESPAVTERLEKLLGQIETNLPQVFALTNQLQAVLANAADLVSNVNVVATTARPAVSNLAAITAHLDQPGALGEWLLPTNLHQQLEGTLTNANAALLGAATNLAVLAQNLNRSLDNLASMTSNLNTQVQANTNLVKAISDAIVHADELVQGLKNHWLLRSAFKPKPEKPAFPPSGSALRSPKDEERRR
jgi:ABC-type transporter Mla subunit MlaD